MRYHKILGYTNKRYTTYGRDHRPLHNMKGRYTMLEITQEISESETRLAAVTQELANSKITQEHIADFLESYPTSSGLRAAKIRIDTQCYMLAQEKSDLVQEIAIEKYIRYLSSKLVSTLDTERVNAYSDAIRILSSPDISRAIFLLQLLARVGVCGCIECDMYCERPDPHNETYRDIFHEIAAAVSSL